MLNNRRVGRCFFIKIIYVRKYWPLKITLKIWYFWPVVWSIHDSLSGAVIWFDAQITIGIWIVKKTTCQTNFRLMLHRLVARYASLGDEKLSLAAGLNGANFFKALCLPAWLLKIAAFVLIELTATLREEEWKFKLWWRIEAIHMLHLIELMSFFICQLLIFSRLHNTQCWHDRQVFKIYSKQRKTTQIGSC